jgi:hypothetical protein
MYFVLKYVIYSCFKQTLLSSERMEDQFIECLKLLHLQGNPDIQPLFVVAIYGDVQVKGNVHPTTVHEDPMGE